jgi:hypothetical protein
MKEGSSSTSPLEIAMQEASRIEHHLCNLLHDEHYLQDRGFKEQPHIVYAADFSEIAAFLSPDEHLLNFSFQIEEDRLGESRKDSGLTRRENLLLKQNLKLSDLLFDSNRQCIILPPHVEELEETIKFRKQQLLDEVIRVGTIAKREVESYLRKNRSVIDYFSDRITTEKHLSDKDRIDLTNFFWDIAPSLLSLLEEEESRGIRRLQRLLDESQLEDLREYRWEMHGISPEAANSLRNFEPDPEIVEQWRRYLSERRPKASFRANRLDAAAVVYIDQLNHTLRKQGAAHVQVHLVTRSPILLELAVESQRLRSRRLPRVPYLRHPRFLVDGKHLGSPAQSVALPTNPAHNPTDGSIANDLLIGHAVRQSVGDSVSLQDAAVTIRGVGTGVKVGGGGKDNGDGSFTFVGDELDAAAIRMPGTLNGSLNVWLAISLNDQKVQFLLGLSNYRKVLEARGRNPSGDRSKNASDSETASLCRIWDDFEQAAYTGRLRKEDLIEGGPTERSPLSEEKLREVFRLFQTESGVDELILDQLDRRMWDFSRNTFALSALGLRLGEEKHFPGRVLFLPPAEALAGKKAPTQLKVTSDNLPIAIEFYDEAFTKGRKEGVVEDLEDLLAGFAVRRMGRATEKEATEPRFAKMPAGADYSDEMSKQRRYERFLAWAVLQASWGHWRISEIYCDAAVKMAPGEIPQHEAWFLLAVAQRLGSRYKSQVRRGRPLAEVHEAALAFLDKATEIKRNYLGQGSSWNDPRYLAEQAAQRLEQRLATHAASTDNHEEKPADDGLQWCALAFQHAVQRKDIYTAVRVRQLQLCYAMATGTTNQALPQWHKDLSQWLAEIRLEWNDDELPPNLQAIEILGYGWVGEKGLKDRIISVIIDLLELKLKAEDPGATISINVSQYSEKIFEKIKKRLKGNTYTSDFIKSEFDRLIKESTSEKKSFTLLKHATEVISIALAPLWKIEDARKSVQECKALLPKDFGNRIEDVYRTFERVTERERRARDEINIAGQLEPIADLIQECIASLEKMDLSDSRLRELHYVMRMDYAYCYLLIGAENRSLRPLALAAARYQEIEEEFPERAIPFFRHGNVFHLLGDYEDAEAKHESALELLDKQIDAKLANSTLQRLRKTVLRQIGSFNWGRAELLRRSPGGDPMSYDYQSRVAKAFSYAMRAYVSGDDRSVEKDEFEDLEDQRIANNLLFYSVSYIELVGDPALLEANGFDMAQVPEWLERIGADKIEELSDVFLLDTIRQVQRFRGDRRAECSAAVRVIQLLAARGIDERPAKPEEIVNFRRAVESLTRTVGLHEVA